MQRVAFFSPIVRRAMDALSQVLRSFRLRGSFRAAWDLGAPWGLSFSPAEAAPWHYVESGTMWVATAGGRRLQLDAGDIVVLFDGAGHQIGDRPDSPSTPIEAAKAQQPASGVKRFGGSGAKTSLVCGNFIVDEREGLAGSLRRLPALVHLRHSARARAFTQTLELLAQELRDREAGSERAAALLTETLFIHVLRAILAEERPGGWLEALRDPPLGAALAAIHGEPGVAWTLASLARTAGISRSILAERFHARLGVPPMTYLARWRLQLAARWLREGELSVSEIIDRVGYGSLAAFHRAFKREYGVTPTRYRDRERDTRSFGELSIRQPIP
jgi:AraC-like DNA-binding protein